MFTLYLLVAFSLFAVLYVFLLLPFLWWNKDVYKFVKFHAKRFNRSENIPKSFRDATFLKHPVEWCGYPMVKKIKDIFIRFDIMHERDRHTDGRADIQTNTAWRHRPRLYIASRDNKWKKNDGDNDEKIL